LIERITPSDTQEVHKELESLLRDSCRTIEDEPLKLTIIKHRSTYKLHRF